MAKYKTGGYTMERSVLTDPVAGRAPSYHHVLKDSSGKVVKERITGPMGGTNTGEADTPEAIESLTKRLQDEGMPAAMILRKIEQLRTRQYRFAIVVDGPEWWSWADDEDALSRSLERAEAQKRQVLYVVQASN